MVTHEANDFVKLSSIHEILRNTRSFHLLFLVLLVSFFLILQVLSTLDSLVMLVKPFSAPECDGCEVPWVDVKGRPSSPPHTISKKSHFPKPVLDSRRSSVHLLQAGERKVRNKRGRRAKLMFLKLRCHINVNDKR